MTYSRLQRRRNYESVLCGVIVLLVMAMSVIAVPPPSSRRAAAPTTSLTLRFTCAQAVDTQTGKVCVHTQPGAGLTIKIKYCSGYYATNSTLKGTKHADAKGNYTWTWTPQTTCHGSATAYVAAALSGQHVSKSDAFTVQ